jgi:HK97 family phage prohead protease
MDQLRLYDVVCRAAIDGDTLIGHAAVFGQVAKVPGGYEQLSERAFDEVLTRAVVANTMTDTTALINHDPHQLLGRLSSKTLRLRADSNGLAFEVDLPDTSYANDLRQLVARGDMTGASFGFIPNLDKSTWSRAKDGSQIHTINAVEALRDVSPVTFPAYSGTGVALRSIDLSGLADSRSQLIRARARVYGKGR